MTGVVDRLTDTGPRPRVTEVAPGCPELRRTWTEGSAVCRSWSSRDAEEASIASDEITSMFVESRRLEISAPCPVTTIGSSSIACSSSSRSSASA